MRLFTPRTELRGSIIAGSLLAAGYILHVWLRVPYSEALFWASLAIGLLYGGKAAWDALSQKRVDIDVLMVVGAVLAAYIGHPEEGSLLLFLFTLSGALEGLAMERTRREVEALHRLMPTEALVLRDGEWVSVDPLTLAAGERIKVRPGERVPADARVETGQSAMDQSAITGESMPRPVAPGDELYAGTINTDDPLEAAVLRPVRESSLQKILDLVTSAREQREPVQRAIDRLSAPYAVSVLALSAVIFLLWWFPMERGWQGAAYTAITFLIVASPCALVIATPTATLCAIARGARSGVLFKGGRSLEALARTRAVCFDKTGTLTVGRPVLYEVHPVAWSDGPLLLGVAAALEADSTHPIARAIVEAATQRATPPRAVESVNHTAGKGIEGTHDGRRVRLGNLAFTTDVIPVCLRGRVADVLSRIQERGHLAVVIAREGPEESAAGPGEQPGAAAVLIMADQVRPGAEVLVKDLHALGVRPVRMLTGDNRLTARRVAESLGLDAFDAELLPADKLAIVARMKTEHPRGVAVIGDGVNDAPALAAADVGVAIGSIGTAAALESADAVLLSDNLAVVPWAIALARSARARIRINFTVALSVIGIMGVLVLWTSAAGRPLPLAAGVLAHEGGTLLVVLNSLLLLATRSPRGLREGAAAPVAATAPAPVAAAG